MKRDIQKLTSAPPFINALCLVLYLLSQETRPPGHPSSQNLNSHKALHVSHSVSYSSLPQPKSLSPCLQEFTMQDWQKLPVSSVHSLNFFHFIFLSINTIDIWGHIILCFKRLSCVLWDMSQCFWPLSTRCR